MSDDINMSSNDSNEVKPRRMRLRPLSSITKEEMIQLNLKGMNDNVSKKKIAQALYYNKQKGRSPLVSTQDEVKAPVHARLGLNKRRVPVIGTNVNNLLPKNKFNYTKGNNNRRMLFSAQSRLHRIRQHNTNQPMLLTNSKRLHLQRTIPNFQVQVPNNTQSVRYTRFRMVLNPVYQDEIREIQLQNPRQIIHGVYPVSVVATSITLHERFASLI